MGRDSDQMVLMPANVKDLPVWDFCVFRVSSVSTKYLFGLMKATIAVTSCQRLKHGLLRSLCVCYTRILQEGLRLITFVF